MAIRILTWLLHAPGRLWRWWVRVHEETIRLSAERRRRLWREED